MQETFHIFRLGLQDALSRQNLRYFLYALLMVVAGLVVGYWLLYSPVTGWLKGVAGGEGWLFGGLAFLFHALFGVLGYLLLPPMVLMVVSLFSERIVENIRQQHYPQLTRGEGIAAVPLILLQLKSFGRYLLLLLLASPLLLLMGVGYLLYLAIGFFLFRRLLMLEVLGVRMPLEQMEVQIAAGGYRWTVLLLYLLTLVPVLNLLVPYLALCIVSHESMRLELREADV